MGAIYNPAAYERAREARIAQNAFTGRRKKFLAEIESLGVEFRAWLLGDRPLELTELFGIEAVQLDLDGNPTDLAEYNTHYEAWRKKYGYPPDALTQALSKWGGLTEKQLQWAKDAYARAIVRTEKRDAQDAERKATAPHWVAGRQEITGTVVYAKWDSMPVGRGHTAYSLKGLITLTDGRKLWTTIPGRFYTLPDRVTEQVKGKELTFSVTIKPKDEDPTFAFGSRPS